MFDNMTTLNLLSTDKNTDQPAVLRVLLGALLVRVLPDHGGQQIRVLELEVEGGVAQRLDLGELLAGRPVPVPETRQVHAVDPLTLAPWHHNMDITAHSATYFATVVEILWYLHPDGIVQFLVVS